MDLPGNVVLSNYDDFENIEKQRETNQIEAKKAIGGLPHSVWETYSAFANTVGGVILLGVEEWDDKTLHPVFLPYPDELIEEFWSILNDKQKVSVNLLTREDITLEDVDGMYIIAINVPKADRKERPVFIGDNPFSGTYVRRGDGDYPCTEEEVKRMIELSQI